MIMPATLVDLETLLRFPSAQQCRIDRAGWFCVRTLAELCASERGSFFSRS